MMKMHQIALAHPDRSWLRKMSLNTTISSQIQMKNRKNQRKDQNTCPVPNSAASIALPPVKIGPHVRSPSPDDGGCPGGRAPPARGWYWSPDHPRWGGVALLARRSRCVK